jgi:hypothetical protein
MELEGETVHVVGISEIGELGPEFLAKIPSSRRTLVRAIEEIAVCTVAPGGQSCEQIASSVHHRPLALSGRGQILAQNTSESQETRVR